jgi:ketosteroid isomerase-like protein
MPENQTSKPIALDELPDVVTSYLSAHRAHDTAAALAAFTDDATVIDAGNTYNGTAAIKNWLNRSSTEFTYTVELTAAHKTDATRYTATNRLEGNFPGGIVDLRYQFALRDGLIERLVIEP